MEKDFDELTIADDYMFYRVMSFTGKGRNNNQYRAAKDNRRCRAS